MKGGAEGDGSDQEGVAARGAWVEAKGLDGQVLAALDFPFCDLARQEMPGVAHMPQRLLAEGGLLGSKDSWLRGEDRRAVEWARCRDGGR